MPCSKEQEQTPEHQCFPEEDERGGLWKLSFHLMTSASPFCFQMSNGHIYHFSGNFLANLNIMFSKCIVILDPKGNQETDFKDIYSPHWHFTFGKDLYIIVSSSPTTFGCSQSDHKSSHFTGAMTAEVHSASMWGARTQYPNFLPSGLSKVSEWYFLSK